MPSLVHKGALSIGQQQNMECNRESCDQIKKNIGVKIKGTDNNADLSNKSVTRTFIHITCDIERT